MKGKNRKKRNRSLWFVLLFLIGLLMVMIPWKELDRWNLLPIKKYQNEDFGINSIISPMDWNHNGKDDYQDFLLGAKKDAKNHPQYDGTYREGGFPPPEVGVCTDVIWRAFREAGYDLRGMVDLDITKYPEDYPNVVHRDPNIDFRRVKNLHVFFDKYGILLSDDPNEIHTWQAGDIVFFEEDEHIGMVSNYRNRKGQVYIIHNGGQPNREEDYFKRKSPQAHYRFDASLVPEQILIPWEQ